MSDDNDIANEPNDKLSQFSFNSSKIVGCKKPMNDGKVR